MKHKLFGIIMLIVIVLSSIACADDVDSSIYADVIIEKMENLDVQSLQRIKDAAEELIKKKQKENQLDTSYLGIWSERYFVDSFGDPTDQRYIISQVDGVFSNTAATNSSLKVQVMVYVEKDKPRMRIEMYEYGSSKVKNGGLEERKYYFTVKDDNSEVHKFTFKMYKNGDKLTADYELKEYNTGEFRVDADFVEMLKSNKTLKFVFTDDDKYGKSTYKFNIDDTTGFENALNWLLENVHIPDEAEIASKPPASFSYKTYEVSAMHLSFDAPDDWISDESTPGVFVLTSPNSYAGYTPKVTIKTEEVEMNYNTYWMEKEGRAQAEKIGENGFKEFSYSDIYQRKFINYKSTYATYEGMTNDGVHIAGRVIVACEDKVLYILDVSSPYEFAKTYMNNVYDVIRDTAKIIK